MSNPSNPDEFGESTKSASTTTNSAAADAPTDGTRVSQNASASDPPDLHTGDEAADELPDNPLKNLPEKQRENIIRAEILRDPQVLLSNRKIQRVAMTVMKSHKGPLPAAEDFELYDRTTPGAGDRIIAMAEKSLAHNIEMTKREQDRADKEQTRLQSYQNSEFHEAGRGQNYGLIICLTGVIAGSIAIALNHPIAGTLFGGTPLVAVAIAFIQGRNRLPVAKSKDGKSGQSEHD